MLNRDDAAQIQQLASQLHKRWTIGDGETVDDSQLPEAWRALLAQGDDSRRRLSLLSLLGQHQLFMYRPEAPELKRGRDLPRLELPTLPDSLRPSFRRLAEQLGKSGGSGRLLQLMARRGYSAHPADWLPDAAADTDIPDLYTPWRHWAVQGLAEQTEITALDEDSWAEYAPAERLALLAEMRRRDPAAARELLRACAGGEAAEQRTRLLEVLKIHLGGDDIDYLRSLAADRSQKVRLLVLQLLARLNAVDADTAAGLDLAEMDRLAEGFRVKKTGLLKRGVAVVPEKLKPGKRAALRLQQLSAVTFQRFAEVLGIAPLELAGGWRFADSPSTENAAFVDCALASATDAELAALLDNLLKDCPPDQLGLLLSPLRERLGRAQKLAVFERLQGSKGLSLHDWEAFLRGADIELAWDSLHRSRAGRALMAGLRGEVDRESYLDEADLRRQVDALALLLDRRGATSALETLTQLGMLRVDPALELLKFNAGLAGEKAPGAPQ